jgi:hypothetical protein
VELAGLVLAEDINILQSGTQRGLHRDLIPIPDHALLMLYLVSKKSFSLCVALQPFVGSWPLFQFLDRLHSR